MRKNDHRQVDPEYGGHSGNFGTQCASRRHNDSDRAYCDSLLYSVEPRMTCMTLSAFDVGSDEFWWVGPSFVPTFPVTGNRSVTAGSGSIEYIKATTL